MKDLFPVALKYDQKVVKNLSVGGNVLFSTEALASSMNILPGMKILDLGCGRGLSSIFLAREYNTQVWAIDNFFSPTDNYQLIKSFGCEANVFPVKMDVRMLPFPENYFDCIVCVNAYTYFGTDDKFLPYICRFLASGGQIGITDICFASEINDINEVPDFLKNNFYDYWYRIHALSWWQKKWNKTGLLASSSSKILEETDFLKKEYINYHLEDETEVFASAMKNDSSDFIKYFTLVGNRNSKMAFWEEAF